MNNQGKDTNTVLTNLSKYVTVVSNEPYCQRKLHRYGLPSVRRSDEERTKRQNFRGARPLHRTTLTLETLPVDNQFVSTMKDSFSGKQALIPLKQPRRCPSLHMSHFSVAVNSDHDMTTTNKNCFKDHSKHPIIEHVDRSRWMNQMAGKGVINSTRYQEFNDIDFLTTYSKNHEQLQSLEVRKPHHKLHEEWKSSIYNIVNGKQTRENTFHSISGDHILYQSRKEPLKNLLH